MKPENQTDKLPENQCSSLCRSLQLGPNQAENVQYDFPDYFSYMRRGFLSQYPDYSAISHWHDDVEFIAVISGEMDYNINGEIVTLHQNEGIFVNSRQLHYGFSEQRNECDFICILLHPLLLCATPQIEQEYILPVSGNHAMPYRKLVSSVDWECRILDAVKKMYFESKNPAPQLLIQSLFYRIWLELYNHAPKTAMPASPQDGQLSAVRTMVGFVQTHYNDKIALDDIAAAGNVCKSKCCSLFRRYLNQTPVNFLISYRLKKSLELIANSDLNMTEIAYEVGFAGASYFSETFRRHYECTPSEYRSKKKCV